MSSFKKVDHVTLNRISDVGFASSDTSAYVFKVVSVAPTLMYVRAVARLDNGKLHSSIVADLPKYVHFSEFECLLHRGIFLHDKHARGV